MEQDVLIWGRVVERLLVVAFSGSALFLGWNLFRVGITDPQSAEVKNKSWTVKFGKVGPGVLFAAFGMSGLIFALASPLSISRGPADLGGNATKSVYYANGSDLKAEVSSINSVIRLIEVQADPAQRNAILSDLASTAATFDSLRARLLLSKLSQDDLQIWHRYGKKYSLDPQSVPGDVRALLSELAPWFTETAR